MASSVSFKERTSLNETHFGSSKKETDLPGVRKVIYKPAVAASGKKKWEKTQNDENVENAARGVLRGKKANGAPDVQFVDTKLLKAEFERRAKEDLALAEQRKNILGTIELLEDAQTILMGSKPKYKHFGSHKRGDKQLQRVCVQMHEGVRQAHERAEALGFSSYFFSRVLPKNGCYEKTTEKITEHNTAFHCGGALFLKEMAMIYQATTSAKQPIPLEAFLDFLEPFAPKFSYSGEDLQILIGEGILLAECKDRSQEIVAALNSFFNDWVAIDGGENLMQLGPFKAYLKANAEKQLSLEEMEQFDKYVDAFFKQNSNAEKLLILKATDWF